MTAILPGFVAHDRSTRGTATFSCQNARSARLKPGIATLPTIAPTNTPPIANATLLRNTLSALIAPATRAALGCLRQIRGACRIPGFLKSALPPSVDRALDESVDHHRRD